MYIGTSNITDWSTWVVVLRSKKYAYLQGVPTSFENFSLHNFVIEPKLALKCD